MVGTSSTCPRYFDEAMTGCGRPSCAAGTGGASVAGAGCAPAPFGQQTAQATTPTAIPRMPVLLTAIPRVF
jgi:hypothetical protein